MIVSYRHDDGTIEEVSTDDLSAIESAAIETATGMEWDDVETALRNQAPTVMRAVLWAFRKRSFPTLRFSDFDLPGWKRRTKARLEYAEIRDMVDALLTTPDANDEARDRMANYMRVMAHEPDDIDKAFAELVPKAAPAAARPAAPSSGPSALPDASETSSTSTGP